MQLQFCHLFLDKQFLQLHLKKQFFHDLDYKGSQTIRRRTIRRGQFVAGQFVADNSSRTIRRKIKY